MTKRFGSFLAALAVAAVAANAEAAVFNYTMSLNAASENPVNPSTGTGSASIIYDDVAHTLALSMTFSGLSGTVTQTHFHGVTATSGLGGDAVASAVANTGVMTTTPSLVGFPLGVSSGNYAAVLDLTSAGSWNPAFVTAQGSIAAAEAAMAGALADGKTYWNVHTSFRTGGEIRGFPVLVPEPTTALLAGLGLVGAIRLHRRQK